MYWDSIKAGKAEDEFFLKISRYMNSKNILYQFIENAISNSKGDKFVLNGLNKLIKCLTEEEQPHFLVFYQSSGTKGKAWAIPTKDTSIKKTLPISEIKPYVDDFIEFAKSNSQFTFLFTEIGCELAGMKLKQIAPLFKEVVNIENIHIPGRFWDYLNK